MPAEAEPEAGDNSVIVIDEEARAEEAGAGEAIYIDEGGEEEQGDTHQVDISRARQI